MATLASSNTNQIYTKLGEESLPTYWVPPKKPPFRENILEDKNLKESLLTHKKQSFLSRYEKEKLKNTFKKQFCIEMLKDGYHKSFRELDYILKLQIQDRYRLGSEHPVWDRPLLDQENEKLEYLCNKLNEAEAFERAHDYKAVFRNNNDLASYFLLRDDNWLSDYFYERSLNIAQNKSLNLDLQRLAEAHANLGLAYERQTNDYTAKSDRIKELYFHSLHHFQEYYNLTKGNDWPLTFQFKDLTKNELENLKKIRNSYVEDNLKNIESQTMFIDSCLHLQRIYRTISYKYAKNAEEKIEYLTKAHEVCKSSFIGALEGQASFLLGNAYSENSNLETALSCYKNYLDISKKEKDLENFGKASEALANCYEKLGQINKSIEYLEKYLQEVSNKHADRQYSRACNCLANIYNSLGKYEMAAECSKKAFDISRQMNHLEAIENNRVLVGIAKAHKNLTNFNLNIELANRKTINNLIKWKYEPEQENLLKDVQNEQEDD